MDKLLDFALGPFGKALGILLAITALIWSVRTWFAHHDADVFKAGQAEVQARWDREKDAQKETALAKEHQNRDQELAWQRGIQAVADNLTQENDREKARTADLQRQLAAGKLRLSYATDPGRAGGGCAPAAAGGAGVADAATRTELPPAVAGFLLGLADDADEVVRDLTACQAILARERAALP